jgi:NAD(P)-dependent dehydrogenase (short-subunit alcohol dehydrogenase family)
VPSILITGASSGIGLASANRFARAGWDVCGTLRDTRVRPATLSDAVSLETLDLADPTSPERLAARVLETRGCPDVLLNNAGLLLWGSIEDTPQEDVERVFRVNVFGQVALIRALVPAMRERGSGTIANVTSLGGRMVFPFFAVYNASKHAMEGFSEGLWHELKPFGIRVVAIEPGYVETPIYDKAMRGGVPGGQSEISSETYRPYEEAMLAFERSIVTRTTPEACADEILDVVTGHGDRLRYPVASYARPILTARRWLGDRAMMRFFHSRWMG